MLTVNVFGTFSHWSLSLNVLYMTIFFSVDYIFDDLLVNSASKKFFFGPSGLSLV